MVVGEAALDAMFAPVPATLQILIYTSSGHEALQKKHRTLGQVHGPVRPFEMAQLHGRNNIPRVQLLTRQLLAVVPTDAGDDTSTDKGKDGTHAQPRDAS